MNKTELTAAIAEKAGMTFRAWVLTAMNDACTDTD